MRLRPVRSSLGIFLAAFLGWVSLGASAERSFLQPLYQTLANPSNLEQRIQLPQDLRRLVAEELHKQKTEINLDKITVAPDVSEVIESLIQEYSNLVEPSEGIRTKEIAEPVVEGVFNAGDAGDYETLLVIDTNHVRLRNQKVGKSNVNRLFKPLMSGLSSLAEKYGVIVYRRGGDEFVMALPRDFTRLQLRQILRELKELTKETKQAGDYQLRLTFSVGIAGPIVGDEKKSFIETFKVAAQRKDLAHDQFEQIGETSIQIHDQEDHGHEHTKGESVLGPIEEEKVNRFQQLHLKGKSRPEWISPEIDLEYYASDQEFRIALIARLIVLLLRGTLPEDLEKVIVAAWEISGYNDAEGKIHQYIEKYQRNGTIERRLLRRELKTINEALGYRAGDQVIALARYEFLNRFPTYLAKRYSILLWRGPPSGPVYVLIPKEWGGSQSGQKKLKEFLINYFIRKHVRDVRKAFNERSRVKAESVMVVLDHVQKNSDRRRGTVASVMGRVYQARVVAENDLLKVGVFWYREDVVPSLYAGIVTEEARMASQKMTEYEENWQEELQRRQNKARALDELINRSSEFYVGSEKRLFNEILSQFGFKEDNKTERTQVFLYFLMWTIKQGVTEKTAETIDGIVKLIKANLSRDADNQIEHFDLDPREFWNQLDRIELGLVPPELEEWFHKLFPQTSRSQLVEMAL